MAHKKIVEEIIEEKKVEKPKAVYTGDLRGFKTLA